MKLNQTHDVFPSDYHELASAESGHKHISLSFFMFRLLTNTEKYGPEER